MSAGNKAVPHQSVLAAKGGGVHFIQGFPASVTVAVTGGADKVSFANPAVPEGFQNLLFVVALNLFDPAKYRLTILFRLLGQFRQAGRKGK